MSLPVYVLSCSAGKSTDRVLSQLVRGSSPERVSAIIPGRKRKKSSNRTREGVSLIRTSERLVRMGKGCSCCTVRGDILQKVRSVAQSGDTDQLVVQIGPATDLSILAKTFTVPDSHGAVLADTANLQSLIVVVTAQQLRDGAGTARIRTLVERIELAQVVLVDSGDEQAPSGLAEAEQIVRAINPRARCLALDSDAVTLAELTSPQPFNFDAAKQRTELEEFLQEAKESGRLVFKARRPFHPQRLHTWLSNTSAKFVRARGMFWIASHPEVAASLDVALGHVHTGSVGQWWAAVPESRRPSGPHFKAHLQRLWDPSFGDRRQELSFVGHGLDSDALSAALTKCLLTDEELADPETAASMNSPFKWN